MNSAEQELERGGGRDLFLHEGVNLVTATNRVPAYLTQARDSFAAGDLRSRRSEPVAVLA